MGIDYHTYVGPYIIAKRNIHIVNIERSFLACDNSKCSKYDKPIDAGKFCALCGHELVSKTKTEPLADYNNWFDLIGDSELCAVDFDGIEEYKDRDVLILNKDIFEREVHINNKYEEYSYDFVGADIEKEKEQFESTLSQTIEILRMNYKSVEIHWGVLCYMS